MTRAGARVQRGAHLVSSLFQFLTLWLHLWGATRGRWLREMDAGLGLLGTPLPRYEYSEKSLPRVRWLREMGAGLGLLGTPLPRYKDSQKSLPRVRWLREMDAGLGLLGTSLP